MNLQDERTLAEFAENIRREYSLGWLFGFCFGCFISSCLTYAVMKIL